MIQAASSTKAVSPKADSDPGSVTDAAQDQAPVVVRRYRRFGIPCFGHRSTAGSGGTDTPRAVLDVLRCGVCHSQRRLISVITQRDIDDDPIPTEDVRKSRVTLATTVHLLGRFLASAHAEGKLTPIGRERGRGDAYVASENTAAKA